FSDEDYSEKKYQDLLINKLQCTYNQKLLGEKSFHSNLPALLDDMDMPSSDGINTWFISRFAKSQGLKAVLSGIGGDEYLGGYPSFSRMKKVKLLEKMPQTLLSAGKYTALKSLKRLGYLSLGGVPGKYLFLRGQFIPFEIASRLNVSEAYVWKVLKENANISIDNLSNGNQASFIEVNYYMQNQLLRDVDVMSMAHGIEIRVPFLDQNMLKLFYRLKSSVKYPGQWPKQLLVDAYKDRLPAPIWKREKMGFGFPFREWLANDDFIKSLSPAKEYTSFVSGNIHWSQFLTSMLIRKFEAA
ncbi:MAG: asparagine synthase C-terminal domain-containing protein, partial [Ginsengibacter sp.]